MTMTIEKSQQLLVIAGGIVVLMLGYKLYSTGQSATKAVGETVGKIVDTVANIPTAVVNATQDAFAETKTFVTGKQYYGPTALSGSMSKSDAIKLADESAERNQKLSDAEEWAKQYPDFP